VVIPHGIYDLVRNRGHINIGLSHDTSQFACDSFRWYWNRHWSAMLPGRHVHSLAVAIAAAAIRRRNIFSKQDLQRLVNDLGIEIRVAHYPVTARSSTRSSARFFPHVNARLPGDVVRPLDTVVGLMRKASTTTGLQTTVNVIRRSYEIGRKVADEFKTAMPIFFDHLLPKWNYTAHPNNPDSY